MTELVKCVLEDHVGWLEFLVISEDRLFKTFTDSMSVKMEPY